MRDVGQFEVKNLLEPEFPVHADTFGIFLFFMFFGIYLKKK